MTEFQTDAAADVMMRLQVITSLQGLVDSNYSAYTDLYAAAARKALRSLQQAHPHLFAVPE